MRVDIGNGKIEQSYSSVLTNPEYQSFYQSVDEGHLAGEVKQSRSTRRASKSSPHRHRRHHQHRPSSSGAAREATPALNSSAAQGSAACLHSPQYSPPAQVLPPLAPTSARRRKRLSESRGVGKDPSGYLGTSIKAMDGSVGRAGNNSADAGLKLSAALPQDRTVIRNPEAANVYAPVKNGVAAAVAPPNKDNPSDADGEPKPKPAPKLAQTKVQPGMRLKRWIIVNRIGAGSFGETFTAVEVPPSADELAAMRNSAEDTLAVTPEAAVLVANLPPDCKEVCIKVEQENKNVLRLEALALKKVQMCPQVVRYLGSGCTSGMNFLVMEKLGQNLAELRRDSPHGTFNIYTTLKAGISCLKAIRGVHEQGLVHRDIKPSNFVTGRAGTPEIAVCYLIDFGLARRYRRSNGEVRPPRDNSGFRGTSRYASVASHHHLELGRVDDLWSLLFMLVEFATGTLPWRKYKEKDDIGRCKEEVIGPHLVRNLPREFQPFLAHLQTLRYEDEPDYDLLLALMQRAVERRGYPPDKPLDWELDFSSVNSEGEPKQPQQQPQPSTLAVVASSANNEAPEAPKSAAAPIYSVNGPPVMVRKASANDLASGESNGNNIRRDDRNPPILLPPSAPSEGFAKNKEQLHALRVSEVEVSYPLSAHAVGDSTPVRQGTAKEDDLIGNTSGRPFTGVRPPADGSETPAVHASSEDVVVDDEDADFSPREANFRTCEPQSQKPDQESRPLPSAVAKATMSNSTRSVASSGVVPAPAGPNTSESQALKKPASPPKPEENKAKPTNSGKPPVSSKDSAKKKDDDKKGKKSKSRCTCALM